RAPLPRVPLVEGEAHAPALAQAAAREPCRMLRGRGRPPPGLAALAGDARLRDPGGGRGDPAPRRGRALALRPGLRAPRMRARARLPRRRRHLVSGTGRMRKVDEGLRQVLSEAIPTLKDPRVGFVTVTAV